MAAYRLRWLARWRAPVRRARLVRPADDPLLRVPADLRRHVAPLAAGAAVGELVVDASGVAAVFGVAIGGGTLAALLILAAYGRVEHGVANERTATC